MRCALGVIDPFGWFTRGRELPSEGERENSKDECSSAIAFECPLSFSPKQNKHRFREEKSERQRLFLLVILECAAGSGARRMPT